MGYKTNSIESAYAFTGRNMLGYQQLLAQSDLPESEIKRLNTSRNYETVIDAINREDNDGKPWIADYADGTLKWELWIWIKKNPYGAGFVVSRACYVNGSTLSYVGARLCFKRKAGAEWFYENFRELIIEYHTA